MFLNLQVFSYLRQTLKEFSEDSRKTSQNTLGKSSNAFYARKLTSHEIFRKSSEVFCPKRYKFWICILCVFIYKILKSYRFNLIWLFCLLYKHKKLLLKVSLFWSNLNVFEYADFSYLSQTLKNFSEDYWKTLRRLLGKYSNVFYARWLPAKSSGSLTKSPAQGGTKEWCEMESKLIYVEELYLVPCLIVLFMACFMICMFMILVVNFFVNLKRC